MDIRPGDFANPQVQALLKFHLENMHSNSPPGTAFALDWSGLQKPDITFLTAWEGDDLLGCGALMELSPEQGEIKSMRTHPDHLRKGVARALLSAVMSLAESRNYKKVSLETGTGEAFEPALTMYRSYGFAKGDPFSDYQPSDFNQFYHFEFDAEAARPNA